LRFEILARHGFKIKRSDLARRFAREAWYDPDTTNYGLVWERLSAVEQYNLWLITDHQARGTR
jgi:hypothetical protein